MVSICLTMIVKNEAHIISRCVESVRPMISTWIIVDTGSTDGTQDVIREQLRDIPGQLYERPWVNFAVNRTEVLELARSWADYSLMMDADDYLELADDFVLPPLGADGYFLKIKDRQTSYQRLQLFNNQWPWRYEGVLHEYPVCDEGKTRLLLAGVCYRRGYEGSSWRDPDKHKKYIAILEAALKDNPEDPRYTYYLAQSYRDDQQWDQALNCYQKRILMGGWWGEIYYSLLQIPYVLEQKGADAEQIWAGYLKAYQYQPQRAESLYYLARYSRIRRDYALAYLFAAQALLIPLPQNSGDFVVESIYTWQALDEYSISAYWTGHYSEALSATHRLLAEGHLPDSEIERVRTNLVFCLNAFGQPHQILSQKDPAPA